MRARLLAGCVGLVLFAIVVDSSSAPVGACSIALPHNVKVEIASESAIVIWDEKAKTEHFIRRATFNTAANDFGFLVPTPNEPTLETVSDDAFTLLAKMTEPKKVTQSRPTGDGCNIGCSAKTSPPGGSPASVEVLQEKDVGGYKAVVLKATDAGKLADWLKENGYESRPALARWLEPYIAENYIITAFKIAKNESRSEGVSSTAVRMSFKTEKPFFPYREPDDMHEAKGKRLLRIFYIGPQKAIGMIGVKDVCPGKIAWANAVNETSWQQLLPQLQIAHFKALDGAWLTEFEDTSSTRLGTADLFFVAHPDQVPVERPAWIVYTKETSPSALPTYLGCAALLLAFYLWRGLQASQQSA